MMREDSLNVGPQGRVGIIGLGFVGLPLSIVFLRKGFDVVGVDYDEMKIKTLQERKSYIRDIEDDEIEWAVASGKFRVSNDYAVLAEVDTIIICVPTPLSASSSPDLTYLTGTCSQLYPVLRSGQLVVIESSTYPGTTKEIVQPLLEQSGLTVGQQFYLAYSPERIDPGNHGLMLNEIPKVVSGITVPCLERVCHLYEQVFDHVVAVSSTEAAETTKLLENTYRFINIAFINEFAQICDKLNVNVWEVIQAAATKPYGFSPFYPGPGVGGHCIPVDPLYLQWKAAQFGISSRFIELSQQINDAMPAYIARRLHEELPSNKTMSEAHILIYGVTYKKNIADVRESAAIPIIHSLLDSGAEVRYHDPFVPSIRLEDGTVLHSVACTPEQLALADCVLICTDHSTMPIQLMMDHSKLIFDTRNAINQAQGKAKLVTFGKGSIEQ
ncbi:MAG: nucleotide sugar dehydrogenase [Candidatus Pristimantibacillus sp.]